MPIPITCEYCEESYRITDKAAGKRIRCKECGEAIDVPGRATSRGTGHSRRAEPPARAGRSRSDSRSRSTAPSARAHVSNRRERQRKDDHTQNVIIGVCCAALAILGGAGFLFYGRSNATEPPVAQNQVTRMQNPATAALRDANEAFRENNRRFMEEQRKRIQADAERAAKELEDFSSRMTPPDMTPPDTTPPGFRPPSMSPPGYQPPGTTPPNSGRSGIGRSRIGGSGFGGSGRPNMPGSGTGPSGIGGSRFGSPFGGSRFGGQNQPGLTGGSSFGGGNLPSSGESDADLQALSQAMQSGQRSARSRAISVLGRSSRQAEAAKILADNIDDRDASLTYNALGRLGKPGETELLKIVDRTDDAKALRSIIAGALIPYGSEKCLPALERLANHPDRFVATMARSAAGHVRNRLGK